MHCVYACLVFSMRVFLPRRDVFQKGYLCFDGTRVRGIQLLRLLPFVYISQMRNDDVSWIIIETYYNF